MTTPPAITRPIRRIDGTDRPGVKRVTITYRADTEDATRAILARAGFEFDYEESRDAS